MHIADFSRGSLGANGIVGGSLAIACGAALTQQMSGYANITVCFFGDGAMNQGSFHEAMNLASLWKLPVLFVCTNNLYGMSTHISRSTAVADLASRGAAYGVRGLALDGNDALSIYERTRAVRQSLLNEGPQLWVLNTYRWYGHSKSDPQVYRDCSEVAAWKEKCPLKVLGTRMVASLGFTDADVAALDEHARYSVDAALVAARAAPEGTPDRAALEDAVYAY
jgi:pyruvate dehydrogenase E1 component alpha subunit